LGPYAPCSSAPETSTTPISTTGIDASDALLGRFLRASQSAFLGAYKTMLGADDIDESLLQLFVIEKAAYELCYELANRPDWVHVPLRGLIETIDTETRA